MINPFWRFLAARKLFYRKSSALNVSGWLESFRRGYPCDSAGAPMPWMNYEAIRFLDERLTDSQALFEFGSGYSTLFYAARVLSVDSVEDSAYWYERMQPQIPDNARVQLQPKDVDGDYCRAISKREKRYDVIVIDGRDRLHCLIQSFDKLTDSGVILLDDSGRDRYQSLIDLALQKGFRFLHFQGLKPTATGLHRTTLFYRDGNCFNI